ncbi:MAG: hypothetical protein K2K74_00145 [Lachnospiraceae bacterium]|nr:hypothetical protein [Lachnospiraceae bacterium]
MYFKMNTEFVHVDIETDEKYVFISGFSGAGKSLFVREVEQLIETGAKDEIVCDLDFYVISNKQNFEDRMALLGDNPCILIADEFYANKIALAIKDKNVYCICVTRNLPSNINFSYKSLYHAERDEKGLTQIGMKYKLAECKLSAHYDVMFMEDSRAGYNYMNDVVQDLLVESTFGKGNILKSMRQRQLTDRLLLFADAGGIGNHFDSIITHCKKREKSGGIVHLILPECFEQMLVHSDLLSNQEIQEFAVVYNNKENFYEMELSRLTKGTVLEYNHEHQKLSECWLKDCRKCDKICEFRVNKPKVNAILDKGATKGLMHFVKEELL